MVRFSYDSDREGIITLWQEAFGDLRKDIDFFLDSRYKPENTLVYDYDGKIASVLFLLDGEMHISGKDYPSYYLYAACTLNEFRGRGLMSELLAFARVTAEKRGRYFICLKPAEESLFTFYEKHGYISAFSKKIVTFSDVSSSASIISDSLSKIDITQTRDSVYTDIDYFKWDNNAVNFAIIQNENYGGKLFENCKGYALYTLDSEDVVVKESAFTVDFAEFSLEFLNIFSKKNKVTFDLPAKVLTRSSEFEIIPSGMLLPLNSTARFVCSGVKDAYLGLTLD